MRAAVRILLLFTLSLASVSAALGQNPDFTLMPQQFSPPAVDPGVSTSTTISVQPVNTVNPPTVNLSCSVAPVETDGPTCNASPASVVAPNVASVTIDTLESTPEISYTITVTGTDASGSQSVNLGLTVVAVTPSYTLTVSTPLNPTSVPQGSGTSGILTVTPLNGYAGGSTGKITLSCSMVTPPVIASPQCSFTAQPPAVTPAPDTVSVSPSGTPARAVITISTVGPNTTRLRTPRVFYALWLMFPAIALAGVGSRKGNARAKALGGLLILTLAAGLLLLPSCGTNTPTTNTSNSSSSNGVTPKNAYTFTITGADGDGLVPSNTAPTVTLTVN
ncbi:MAG TPA: hypothetical protein VMU61_01215 [Candidatus Aquilonibacter sp.]|nr:hypothetical protein [Candidatus Aquilonibacter sp.]